MQNNKVFLKKILSCLKNRGIHGMVISVNNFSKINPENPLDSSNMYKLNHQLQLLKIIRYISPLLINFIKPSGLKSKCFDLINIRRQLR